jgi:hypothetical protein
MVAGREEAQEFFSDFIAIHDVINHWNKNFG